MNDTETYGPAQRLIVPGGYGRLIDVKKGQYVAVRDIEGGQCGDFWAIDANNFDHFKRGDKITMIAKMALIVVVSACPMDLNPIGGQGITDLEIVVADTEEEILRV